MHHVWNRFQADEQRFRVDLYAVYQFQGGGGLARDGAVPQSRVVFGRGGGLYGTTSDVSHLEGTVYRVMPSSTPPVSPLQPWSHTVLTRFPLDGSAGIWPSWGDLAFDASGNIYGTTIRGGTNNQGVVYELMRGQRDWTESVLYSFGGAGSGSMPYGGVIFDSAGNLYGTTYGGVIGWGTVFQLSRVGSTWVQTVIHAFQGRSDGAYPYAGLIFDGQGNLYGATTQRGSNGGGTVFQLVPSNGGWTFNLIYSFSGNGGGPVSSLILDGAGNLYGTTGSAGAYGYGSAFKLAPGANGWVYTDLHDFSGGTDGAYPDGTVAIDASGNLYGTAYAAGVHNGGVVWEIAP